LPQLDVGDVTAAHDFNVGARDWLGPLAMTSSVAESIAFGLTISALF